jgi:polyribonucleotide nucleotidyltransferase
MEQALEQAKDGRIHILKQMAKAIKAPRKELSAEAPQIATIEIDASKIKDVIGSGGKVIKEITAETDTKIEIKEEGKTGTVVIAGSSENIEKAKAIIEGIVKEPEFGEVYDGEVVDMKPFGAFVNLMPGKDGFLHISEISDERTENIEDAIKVGQVVKVVVLGMDRGKVKVSMKRVGQKLNKKDFENQDNGRDRRNGNGRKR